MHERLNILLEHKKLDLMLIVALKHGVAVQFLLQISHLKSFCCPSIFKASLSADFGQNMFLQKFRKQNIPMHNRM